MVTIYERIRQRFQGRVTAAIVEIFLIFIGITLAIAFENQNDERRERAEEQALLRELRSNLEDNVTELKSDIDYDTETIKGFEAILAHLSARLPYSEDLSRPLADLENWDSPYLTSSAYETLKSRGLDLISDSTLRHAIVRLFEDTYAELIYDQDRMEWINLEASMLPAMLKHVEESPGRTAKPIDYQALLDDRSFRVAILRSATVRTQSVQVKEDALDATSGVIELISANLHE